MNREEAVAELRKSEPVQNALVLTGRDAMAQNLRKVALAWPQVPVKKDSKLVKNRLAGSVDELWEQLWIGITPDLPALRLVTGLTNVAQYFASLKGYRLIYPDGQLSQVAEKTLRMLAKAELGLP